MGRRDFRYSYEIPAKAEDKGEQIRQNQYLQCEGKLTFEWYISLAHAVQRDL